MKTIAALALSLVLFFGLALPAAAQLGDADKSAFQSIVTGQIEAFRGDNGTAAYDFASPTIRNLFPTADIFMEMVEKAYPQVYRPESFAFGPVFESKGVPVQRVFITGPDGANYVAEYTFQRQPDGSWKINGVTLKKDDSPTI